EREVDAVGALQRRDRERNLALSRTQQVCIVVRHGDPLRWSAAGRDPTPVARCTARGSGTGTRTFPEVGPRPAPRSLLRAAVPDLGERADAPLRVLAAA